MMAITIVTGIPRSGTSMMMNILQAGGLECLAEERAGPVAQFNPNGYFEHTAALTGKWTDADLVAWDGKAVKILDMITRFPADVDVRVIVMRRAMEKALASMWAISDGLGLPRFQRTELFQGNLDSIRLWCADKPHLEIWYDDVLRNTPDECLRIQRFLGRPLDLAAMARVTSPDLRHHA